MGAVCAKSHLAVEFIIYSQKSFFMIKTGNYGLYTLNSIEVTFFYKRRLDQFLLFIGPGPHPY